MRNDNLSRLPERNARQHLVPLAAEKSQHSTSIIVIARLAKNLSIDDDHRVSANYEVIGKFRRDSLRLGSRETLDVAHRILRCQSGLVDIGGDCVKLPAHGSEYFLAA
jgi:hypothetical protein